MCGVGRTVFVVSSSIGIHHWLDRLFLGFAVLVEVIVIHIEGTVTFEAEAEPLGEHHSLGVFELVIGIPQTGVKLTLHVKVDIYFTGVGMISIPSEEELLAMMEDIRKNPEEYRLAAQQKETVQPFYGVTPYLT